MGSFYCERNGTVRNRVELKALREVIGSADEYKAFSDNGANDLNKSHARKSSELFQAFPPQETSSGRFQLLTT